MASLLNTFRGPYRLDRSVRLATHPPAGRTGVTGYALDVEITGPTNGSYPTKAITMYADPVLPLWEERMSRTIGAYAVAVNYITNVSTPGGSVYQGQMFGVVGDLDSVSTGYVTQSSNSVGLGGSGLLKFGNINNWWPTLRTPSGELYFYVPKGWKLTHVAWHPGSIASAANHAAFSYETWNGFDDKNHFERDANTFAQTGMAAGAIAEVYGNNAWIRPVSVILSGFGNTQQIGPGVLNYTMVISPNHSMNWGTGVGPMFTCDNNAQDDVMSLWPVQSAISLAHLTAHITSFDAVIMHSATLSLENVTKTLNKEGSIVAGAIRLSTLTANGASMFIPTQSLLGSLDPAKRYSGAAAKGITCYVDPSYQLNVPNENLITSTRQFITLTRVTYPVFAPRPGDVVCQIFLTDADTGTPSTFLGKISLEWEYPTSMTIFPTGVATMSVSDVDKAINRLVLHTPFQSYRPLYQSGAPKVAMSFKGKTKKTEGGKPKKATQQPNGDGKKKKKNKEKKQEKK